MEPQQSPSVPDEVIPGKYTKEEQAMHEGFMREALGMAELALATDETPVGCVFVYNGTVIGRGMNATNRTRNGTRHAELVAIAEILSSQATTSSSLPSEKLYSAAILKECDLYVTVEPCIMCASLLRQYGIRKVYFGAKNERFGGTGGVLSIHEGDVGSGGPEKGFPVEGGWLRGEAIMLLRRFYVQENIKAPEPRSKKDRKLNTEIEPLSKLQDGTG